MQITWHSSACVSIESNGTNILFDPWLEAKAFLGSWAQWPPVEDTKNLVLETRYDYIIYTHFHSDHFDSRFLSRYLRAMSRVGHIPTILVAENSWNQLARSIINIAGDKAIVKSVQSGLKIDLNTHNFSLTLYCSDHCDPILCGKSIPCFSNNPKFRSIDSVAVIQDEDNTVVNFNDAIFSNLDLYLQKIGIKADLVMGVFCEAGSWPQCHTGLASEEVGAIKTAFIENALKKLAQAAECLRAKYIFPFGGQYILVGDLAKLNDNRAVLPVSNAKDKLRLLTDKNIVTLNPNESISLTGGDIYSQGSEYVEPSIKQRLQYLDEHSEIPYFFERRNLESVNIKSLESGLQLASRKLSKMYSEPLNYSILITDKSVGFRWQLNFGNDLTWGNELARLEDYCEITLDLRLLESCVKKTPGYGGFTSMHWNQAHIGSHLQFNQSKYNQSAHYLLNFLHT